MARLNFRNYPDVGMMAIGGARPTTSYVYPSANTPPEVAAYLAGAGNHLKVLARDVVSGSQFVLRDADAGGHPVGPETDRHGAQATAADND
jgi:hypothetical protein